MFLNSRFSDIGVKYWVLEKKLQGLDSQKHPLRV